MDASKLAKKAKKVKKSKKSKKVSAEVADVVPVVDDKAARKAKKKAKKAKKKRKLTEMATSSESTEVSKKRKVEPAAVPGSKLSDAEIMAWREKHEVKLDSETGEEYTPMLTFKEASKFFSADILKITESFKEPSPIQAQAWPPLLQDRDVVGVAETGSGKTLGFLFPGIVRLKKKTSWKKGHPGMLVCAPTRELAMQSAKVAEEVGKHCGMRSMCVFGGTPKWQQRKDLNNIIHILVATPGRLLDQLNDNALSLSEVTYMVLDEADRMLDQGFEKDIRRIFGYCPTSAEGRQSLLFTATWPESIQKIAKEFIHNPIHITVGSLDLTANTRVTQIVEVIQDRARDARVLELLKKYHSSRKNLVLLFVLYKKEASRVEHMLQKRGYNCCSIHGNLTQEQRTRSFTAFKSGTTPLLIATDVAARGLDIPNVSHVINYSFPLTIEDYIHRIGRTGRAGKFGIAHTFFQECDKPRAGELQNVLRDANMDVPKDLIKFGSTVKRKAHSMFGAYSRAKGGPITKKATKITFDSDSDDE